MNDDAKEIFKIVISVPLVLFGVWVFCAIFGH